MTPLELQPASAGTGVISTNLRDIYLQGISTRSGLFFCKNLHDAIGGFTSAQKISHYLHLTVRVVEKSLITCTEVVQSHLAIWRFCETILRTLAVAGKEKPAFTAIAGQSILLISSELELLS